MVIGKITWRRLSEKSIITGTPGAKTSTCVCSMSGLRMGFSGHRLFAIIRVFHCAMALPIGRKRCSSHAITRPLAFLRLLLTSCVYPWETRKSRKTPRNGLSIVCHGKRIQEHVVCILLWSNAYVESVNSWFPKRIGVAVCETMKKICSPGSKLFSESRFFKEELFLSYISTDYNRRNNRFFNGLRCKLINKQNL